MEGSGASPWREEDAARGRPAVQVESLLCLLATWKLFSLQFQLKVAYLSPAMLIYNRSKISGEKRRRERKG